MENRLVNSSNVSTPPPAYSTGQPHLTGGQPHLTGGQPTPPMVYPTEPPPKYDDINGPNYDSYQAGAYPAQNPSSTTYIYTQAPAVTVLRPAFGQFPVPLQCHYCQASITTATVSETGALTWLASGMLCLFGCWLGCCLIPFCISDLQDVVHQCPNCQKVVGIYRRLG